MTAVSQHFSVIRIPDYAFALNQMERVLASRCTDKTEHQKTFVPKVRSIHTTIVISY